MSVYCSDTIPPPKEPDQSEAPKAHPWLPIDPNPPKEPVTKDSDLPAVACSGSYL